MRKGTGHRPLSSPSKTRRVKTADSGPQRIQKIIADAGLASRRKAEEWIVNGWVTVNGEIAPLGAKANPGEDEIRVRGKRVETAAPRRVTVMVNKPKGWICSNQDPHHERTVFDLLPPNLRSKRLFCAGRLDLDSEGLLILTNDGELANRLTHPSSEIVKRYRIRLHRPLEADDIPKLLKGRPVEGEWYKVDRLVLPQRERHQPQSAEVHLSHGKKREIRVLFEAFGYHVKKLKRIQIGGLVMKGLPAGGHRLLKGKELEKLFQS